MNGGFVVSLLGIVAGVLAVGVLLLAVWWVVADPTIGLDIPSPLGVNT